MTFTVLEYLKRATGQTIPPMVLELVLRSGRSFYVKTVFPVNEATGLVPVCVWDLRALDQADHETVLRRLSTVTSRHELENVERLHPKLDHGTLWVLISEVEAIMEWHDRFWPPVEDPEHRQVRIGVQS
ncbi:MAG: hypothetical protein H6R40_772 [Gemmatimonadetes bacterium]|nr:hypothetical protein [Gemmatimonadota bacterium]